MHKVEIVTYTNVQQNDYAIEACTRVSLSADGTCSAVRTVGRGIDWMLKWRRGEPMPHADGMTAEQRDEVAASLTSAAQRMGDVPLGQGGFTPRNGPTIPDAASFR